MRDFKSPPLSFMGNKKNMLPSLNKILEDLHYAGRITPETVFYDVFGGSGLLSHALKRKFRNNRVIWNDYDNYKTRLDHIDETSDLQQKLAHVFENFNFIVFDKDKKITDAWFEAIKNVLAAHTGFFDVVQLSSWLCFSGNYLNTKEDFLKQKCFYNHLRFSKLDANGYLEGVERVQMDYKDLINHAYEESGENAFLVLDPPYLQTQKKHYAGKFWNLSDFLWLLSHVRGDRFIFFASEGSDILEFLNFIKYSNNLQNLQNLHFERATLNISTRNGDFAFYKKPQGLFTLSEVL